MSFGERITDLRKKGGITQEQLAKSIGVTRQTISKWELDQSVPDLDYMGRLCKLFGVTTDYLIKGVESIKIEENIQEPDKKAETGNVVKSRGGVGVTVVGILLIIFGVYVFLEDEWLEGIWVALVGVELVVVRKHPIMGVISSFLSITCMLLFMFAVRKVYVNIGSELIIKHYDYNFAKSQILQVVSVVIVMIQGLIIGFGKRNVYNIVLLAAELLALLYVNNICMVALRALIWPWCFFYIAAFLTLNYHIHNRGVRI